MTRDDLDHVLELRSEFLGYLTRRVGDRDLAEDLLQAAYLKGLKAAGPDRSEAVRAWFYRVLRSTLVDRLRRLEVERKALRRFAAETDTVVEGDGLEAAVCRCIAAAITGLKPEYRDLLRRVELDGMSPKDAAQLIGIEAGNARVRLHRARAALRRRLLETCGACAEHGCLDCSCATGRNAAAAVAGIARRAVPGRNGRSQVGAASGEETGHE